MISFREYRLAEDEAAGEVWGEVVQGPGPSHGAGATPGSGRAIDMAPGDVADPETQQFDRRFVLIAASSFGKRRRFLVIFRKPKFTPSIAFVV